MACFAHGGNEVVSRHSFKRHIWGYIGGNTLYMVYTGGVCRSPAMSHLLLMMLCAFVSWWWHSHPDF